MRYKEFIIEGRNAVLLHGVNCVFDTLGEVGF